MLWLGQYMHAHTYKINTHDTQLHWQLMSSSSSGITFSSLSLPKNNKFQTAVRHVHYDIIFGGDNNNNSSNRSSWHAQAAKSSRWAFVRANKLDSTHDVLRQLSGALSFSECLSFLRLTCVCSAHSAVNLRCVRTFVLCALR